MRERRLSLKQADHALRAFGERRAQLERPAGVSSDQHKPRLFERPLTPAEAIAASLAIETPPCNSSTDSQPVSGTSVEYPSAAFRRWRASGRREARRPGTTARACGDPRAGCTPTTRRRRPQPGRAVQRVRQAVRPAAARRAGSGSPCGTVGRRFGPPASREAGPDHHIRIVKRHDDHAWPFGVGSGDRSGHADGDHAGHQPYRDEGRQRCPHPKPRPDRPVPRRQPTRPGRSWPATPSWAHARWGSRRSGRPRSARRRPPGPRVSGRPR